MTPGQVANQKTIIKLIAHTKSLIEALPTRSKALAAAHHIKINKLLDKIQYRLSLTT